MQGSLVNLEGLALSIDEDYRVLEVPYDFVICKVVMVYKGL